MVLARLCPICQRRCNGLCSGCVRSLRPAPAIGEIRGLDQVVGLFRYDQAMARVVLAAKNGGRRDLLDWLAEAMGVIAVDRLSVGRFDAVTWMPAARHHHRRRGYDQSRLLAAGVGDAVGVRARATLVRRRGESQAVKPRADRASGPNLRCPRPVTGTVLVVDDVITTGASLAQAAAGLRRAGASRVVAVVAASAH